MQYRVKTNPVEAIQLKSNLVYNGHIFKPGTWIITCNTSSIIMSDEEFHKQYEKIEPVKEKLNPQN